VIKFFAKAISTFAVFTALVMGQSHLNAGVVFSDNFNSETLGLNVSVLNNWTVSDGSIDVIGTGFFDLQPGNGRYIDLDGSTGNAGVLATRNTFGPGTFLLTFDLAGNNRASGFESVIVRLGDFSQTISNIAQNQAFASQSLSFTTTVAGKLSFENIPASGAGDNIGALLDNVQLSTAAVPEPSTLAMFVLGAVSLQRLRRRNPGANHSGGSVA
jgi:hypothetical protein